MAEKKVLTEEEKKRISSNINRLDYLHGTGVLSTKMKKLADELYIFIGAGGTGCKALKILKNTLKDNVVPEDFSKIAFLAIDTSFKELDELVANEEFESSEILKIPFEGAHDSIDPNQITPELKAWVHKDLWRITGAKGNPDAALQGTGAGKRRQCGRLLLSQTNAQTLLYDSLMRISENKLADRDEVNIKIFFLTGLAGGTGSGTIVDLAYLTRHLWKELNTEITYARTTFSSYLFLPSASGRAKDQNAARSGNRNAYAALKEIDHYMTIQERGEEFIMNYGNPTGTISIPDNIFNFCTLVEGIGANGVVFKNAAETAKKVVADSILNMICVQDTMKQGVNSVFMVDSFLSNKSAEVENRVTGVSDNIWPRDTNYLYSVIGYSSCIVPIELITVYMVKKIFDKMFATYNRYTQASKETTNEFIIACGLDIEKLANNYITLNQEKVCKAIQSQADAYFKAYGPYFMINLTKEAKELIGNEDNDYKTVADAKYNYAVNQLNRWMIYPTKEARQRECNKWKTVIDAYNCAEEYLLKMNNELYGVYTYVLEVLKQLIDDNAKLLTDTHEFKSVFGNSFCWSPVDLTQGSKVGGIIKKYLIDIYSNETVDELANKFVDELCNKKNEWTGWNNEDGVRTDIAKNIREFISNNLKKCINTSIEDFVVKIYSEDKDAKVFEEDSSGAEVATKQTKLAASEIYKKLKSQSSPMAAVSNSFKLSQCYNDVYITLPAQCKYLYDEIKNIATGCTVLKSSANDRIVWYKLYAGVPAWALEWTKTAEANYETGDGPNHCGLHMSQSEENSKNDWSRFPNLYPEKLWSRSEVEASQRHREAAISAEVRKTMHIATEMGVVLDNGTPEYDMYLLSNEKMKAEELLERAELKENTKYTLKQVIDILIANGTLMKTPISFTNQVMTTPDQFNVTERQEYRYEMAGRTLRRIMNEYDLLVNTVNVLKDLEKILDEIVVIDNKLFPLFVGCLKWELLTYDKDFGQWIISIKDDESFTEESNDKFQKIFAHYFAFITFSTLDSDAIEEIREKLKEYTQNAKENRKLMILANERQAQIKESLKILRTAKKDDVAPWPDNSPFAIANNNPWPMASTAFERVVNEKGYDKFTIRNFYDDLIDNM